MTMLDSSLAPSLSAESITLLERRLSHFRSVESTLTVARRLFQKCPGAAEAIRTEMEASAAAVTASQKLWLIRRLLVRTVAEVINNSASAADEGGMPKKMENYLSFLDLAAVVASCVDGDDGDDVSSAKTNKGVSARTWRTFLLKEFDPASVSGIPLHKLRRRLKHFLPETNLSSVQLDIEEKQDVSRTAKDASAADMPPPSTCRRVYFRVATVQKTKTGKNDERNLMKKPATFLVYYAGEPYFYCDRAEPDSDIADALCHCLNSEGYAALPLSGPHLESLRRMRLRRDAAKDGRRVDRGSEGEEEEEQPEFDQGDLFKDFEGDEADDDAENRLPVKKRKRRRLPILNRLTVERSAKFKEDHILEAYHGGRLKKEVDQLDVRLTFHSADVLNSLGSLADCGVMASGGWLEDAASRGRNVIRVKESSAALPGGAAGNDTAVTDVDNVSVVNSEMTVIR